MFQIASIEDAEYFIKNFEDFCRKQAEKNNISFDEFKSAKGYIFFTYPNSPVPFARWTGTTELRYYFDGIFKIFNTGKGWQDQSETTIVDPVDFVINHVFAINKALAEINQNNI